MKNIDPLQWVLPLEDPEYAEALAVRAAHPEQYSRVDGLYGSLGVALVLIVLRYLEHVVFRVCSGRGPKKLLSASVSAAAADRLEKVEEGLWVSTGGIMLATFGWQCLHSVRSTCSIVDSVGCVASWPLIPIPPMIQAYYNVELGWYLQLMVKQHLGLGLADSATMSYHHWATVALIVCSYLLNMHLPGLLVFALMNLSTPMLHLSKLAHLFNMKATRVQLFIAFAVVFLFSRVLLFPYIVLKCAMVEAAVYIRGLFKYFLYPWLVCNALLVVLSVMQVIWFIAIVRIMRAVQTGSDSSIDKEVARRDVLISKTNGC